MSHAGTMHIFQGGTCIGEVERVRIHRGRDAIRCAFDLSGDVAVVLDDEIPAVLRAPDGTEHRIRISRRYYSNGSFRVNGFVEPSPSQGP